MPDLGWGGRNLELGEHGGWNEHAAVKLVQNFGAAEEDEVIDGSGVSDDDHRGVPATPPVASRRSLLSISSSISVWV